VRVEGPRYAPVVVMESGAGQDLSVWTGVKEELSEVARVVTWSRPGLGRSEMGFVERSSPRIVEELRGALKALEVEPPYILVGHALGTFHVRAFAAMHREEVSAMVLVDPSHEDWLKRLKLTHTEREWRDIRDTFQKEVNLFPEGIRREYASLETDTARMTRLPTLPAVPIWILSCTRFGEAEERAGRRPEDVILWEELHTQLASEMNMDSVVEHQVRPDLGSAVLSEHPEVVAEGVRWALRKLKER
jgi:pimeloyl-ACP methyl ester carboxylesterase